MFGDAPALKTSVRLGGFTTVTSFGTRAPAWWSSWDAAALEAAALDKVPVGRDQA